MITKYIIWYCSERDEVKIAVENAHTGAQSCRSFHLSPDGSPYTRDECYLSINEVDPLRPAANHPKIIRERLDQVFPSLEKIAEAFPGAKSISLLALRPHNLSCFSVCRQLETLILTSDVQVDLSGIEYLDTLVSLTIRSYLENARTTPLSIDLLDGMKITYLGLGVFTGLEEKIDDVHRRLDLSELKDMTTNCAAFIHQVSFPTSCRVVYSSPYRSEDPDYQRNVAEIRELLPNNPLEIFSFH